jgi:hypothetical protein
MTTKPKTAAIGLFHDPSLARQAVHALKQAGFRDDQIGVLAPPLNKAGDGRRAHTVEGAVAGVAAGAGAGALWALGMAAGLLPGIGPVLAGGVLASVLASAAGTAAVVGVVGALVGMGIPEEEAKYYESEFMEGRTIVSVQAEGRAAEAWTILKSHAGYNRRTASSVR